MSHIYQPVMVKTLLGLGGRASRRQIAAAFLSQDESQLDYYERIVRAMPGSVLRRHGVVEKDGEGYALTEDCRPASPEETLQAIQACDEAIEAYKAKRGRRIWEHRAPGLGRIPGRLRYETLKRAGFRCELCGIPADERALDVDHIVPRRLGGPDSPENLQALCWKCNADKGAGDDTDFREVLAGHAKREDRCPFCDPPEERIVAENTVALALRDKFPVADLAVAEGVIGGPWYPTVVMTSLPS